MKKLLSVLLALAIVLSFATVFAGEEVTPPSDAGQETESVSPTGETQSLPRVDLKKQIVPREEVPDLIDYEVAVAEKYVCRAYWEETSLNEVVFLKADGSLARYVFSFPVKYEADGEVYDKKPELEARETLLANKYRYQLSAQNDTVLYCAENLADGFYFEGEGLQVNLRPITETEYNFLRGHIDADDFVTPIAPGGGFASSFVTYDSVAVTATAQSGLTADSATVSAPVYALSTQGEQAAFVAVQDRLAVVPSYTGFQVQLDLAENFAPSTVYFELDPNGLTLIREEDTLILVDRSGDAVGVVGDLLSSRGMSYDVAYDVIALDNGTYLLSATLPRTSGGIYTTSVTSFYSGIQDASLYSVNQTAYGSSRHLYVGRLETVSGIGRAVIRPDTWLFTRRNYPNEIVQSASLVVRDVMGDDPATVVECRPFTGSNWNESNATWNSVNGGNYGELLSSNTVSPDIGWDNGYTYVYDITSVVADWYSGNASQVKGVVLKGDATCEASSVMIEKTFASSEYPTEAYRPYFSITTAALPTIPDGVYYIESKMGGFMKPNTTPSDGSAVVLDPIQNLSSNSKIQQLWRVHHVQNGYYTVRPFAYTYYGLSSSGTVGVTEDVGYVDTMESVTSTGLWKIRYRSGSGDDPWFDFEQYGGLYLKAGLSSNSTNLVLEDGYAEDRERWAFEACDVSQMEQIRVYDTSGSLLHTDKISDGNNAENTVVRYAKAGDSGDISLIDLKVSFCMEDDIHPSAYVLMSSDSSVSDVNSVLSNPSETVDFDFTANGVGHSEILVWINEETLVNLFTLNVVTPFFVGNYAIENVATGKFVQGVSFGNSVEQWDFSGSDAQLWNIQPYNDSGYYTIMSTATSTFGYYLGVLHDTSTEYSMIILRSGTIADGTLWVIALNCCTGYYVMKPKCSLGTSTVFASIQTTEEGTNNGSALVLLSYYDNSVYNDEWKISSVKYKHTINHYYDAGFAARFGENTLDILSYSQIEMAKMMLEVFGLVCIQNTYSYISVCDTCKSTGYPNSTMESVLDSPCACSGTSCLTSDALRNQLLSDDSGIMRGSPTSTTVFWTGHRLDGDARSNSRSWYESDTAWTVVMTMYKPFPYDKETGTSTARPYGQQCRLEAHSLFHELCHQLGAPDHYCKFESGDDEESTATKCSNESCDLCWKGLPAVRNCAMGNSYYLDVHTADSILCSDCKDGINSHLDDHHEEV